jgi:very-short-patch-repair endonuclease/predicted transcriptional regulator of viral defense system
MGYLTHQSSDSTSVGRAVWELVARQHGVVSHDQLVGLGVHSQAIKHRVHKGRLHPIARGIYAVGRPQLTQYGKWMAAVLACGPLAALSHFSAAALWRVRPSQLIEVTIRADTRRRRPGIRIHRRPALTVGEITTHLGIPVTTPACTIVDLAVRLPQIEVERAINQADTLDVVHVADLREALDDMAPRPGLGVVKRLIDRRTFRLTRSQLESIFIPLSVRAGLGIPLTREWVNGFEVDFFYPEVGLVVETDGGQFHRTPSQQTADRRRDQAHLRAGLTPLRFTHEQVFYERAYVRATIAAVARRLSSPSAPATARRA